jgi:hypothetical protein
MNARNEVTVPFELLYDVEDESFRQMGKHQAVNYQSVKPPTLYDNGYLFFLTADVEEDNPGDCLVDFSESEIWEGESSGPADPYHLTTPDGKTTNYVGRKPSPWGGEDMKNPIIAELKPERRNSPCCTKRIVVVDFTANMSSEGHPKFGTKIKAWGALQEMRIYDTEGNSSTMRHRFGAFTRRVAPYDIEFFGSEGSSDPIN